MLDGLRVSARPPSDDRRAGSHRFHRDETERFRPPAKHERGPGTGHQSIAFRGADLATPVDDTPLDGGLHDGFDRPARRARTPSPPLRVEGRYGSPRRWLLPRPFRRDPADQEKVIAGLSDIGVAENSSL